MDIIVLGQGLLGFLVVVALLVNIQLLRLGRRNRDRSALLAPVVAQILLWLPLAAGILAIGGVALAESSLLSYHQDQDVNGLSWFVVGAGLAIFANVCAAMTWITLREAFKTPDTL